MNDSSRQHEPGSFRMALILGASVGLSGCGALAMTALGVGASAGVNHTANGISTRTFTATAPQVRTASLVALQRMAIPVESIEQRDGAEVIKAKSADRRIEVEIEAMSKSTTQIRATAKLNLFVHDGATAKEIVEQTDLAIQSRLGERSDRRARPGGTTTELVRASSL